MIFRLSLIACLVFLNVNAQDNPRPRPGRGAQGTHDFLGLGAAPDPAAAARGAKLFVSNCSFCHGAKATGGDTGPDLVRSGIVLHDEKGELIGPVIHNGRVNKGMPAFAAFTEAELYDLAEFLHSRVESAANRGTYQLLNVVTGDPQAGREYFTGAGKCSSCHSVTADLAHIGSKMTAADLQQTFLYPGARSTHEPGTPRVTVTLSSGESMEGALKSLDDFTVGLYDKDGEYHSIALGPKVKVDVEDKLAEHRKLLDKYTDSEMHNLTAYLQTLK